MTEDEAVRLIKDIRAAQDLEQLKTALIEAIYRLDWEPDEEPGA